MLSLVRLTSLILEFPWTLGWWYDHKTSLNFVYNLFVTELILSNSSPIQLTLEIKFIYTARQGPTYIRTIHINTPTLYKHFTTFLIFII